jgi:hypothetical protein
MYDFAYQFGLYAVVTIFSHVIFFPFFFCNALLEISKILPSIGIHILKSEHFNMIFFAEIRDYKFDTLIFSS